MSAAHRLTRLDATALAERHRTGEARVGDTLDTVLAAIERGGPRVGAFASLDADAARARADQLDRGRDHGAPAGPLFGVPFARKSNLCAAGRETHCGSALLAGWRPPYTATVLERLEAAGAVLIGATHMDEFAMGSSGENGPHPPARNPWDLERTPGGSSSGSAAAVAARLVPFALGSDTGGSARQPASFCGVVGLKPTYGRVSRRGLVAFGSSLDQVSPLSTTVRDARRVLAVLAGPDPYDATSLEGPFAAERARVSLAGLRIGVPREHLAAVTEPAVRASVEAALAVARTAGAEVVELSLPHTHLALAAYYVVATAEASSNLARFDGIRFGRRVAGDGSLDGMLAASRNAGFGAEVKRRILLGTYALSGGYHDAWYGQAARVRLLVRRDFEQAFATVDLVLGPTSPTTAFRLGERAADPLAMYRADALTVPASLAGLPALSLPCGTTPVDDHPLPIGLQLIAPAGADAALLDAAETLEEHLDLALVPAEVPS